MNTSRRKAAFIVAVAVVYLVFQPYPVSFLMSAIQGHCIRPVASSWLRQDTYDGPQAYADRDEHGHLLRGMQ